jgi:two-component system, OmpR family, phosphate regulon sensor histidine kinase PhoR
LVSDNSASPSSARRLAARWRAGLMRNAAVLTAALGAILLLALLAGRPLLGIGLIVAVLTVAFAGSRPAATRRTAPPAQKLPAPSSADAGRLSAAELSEAIGDPLILCNALGVVMSANRAASAAFGQFMPGDLIALRFRSPEMQALIDSALRGAPSAAIEHAERVPIERSFKVGATMVGGDGRFALFFRDQSETRRIDRMRADFIANASHELRTPLASISGFIETLAGPAKNDPQARERFLAIMQNQTGRMARLIDDLLSLSRLEMKPLAGAESRVDLGDLARQVTVSLSQMIRENGMVLALDLKDAPVPIVANPDEIVQVLENLIENACKYGQSGKRLDISLSTERDEASLTVRDHGPGIPTEHIPRLTERFYRVDVETSRAQKGTGLGLAIVKHILSRHQGRLTIRSAPGEGASFTIHLPLAEDSQT